MTPAPLPEVAPIRAGSRGGAERLLVVRLSALGDVLHTLPAVAALRRARPHARIDWVVEDRAAAVLRGHPDLDEVVVFERAAAGGVEALRRVRRGLRRRGYDATIDFQGNLKSGAVAWLSGAPRRHAFGPPAAREGSRWLANRLVPPPTAVVHRVDRALALVEAFLGEPAPAARALLPADPRVARRVEEALLRAGLPARGFLAVHAGTSGFGRFKRWPAWRVAALCDLVARETGVPTALTAGPGEEALVGEVLSRCRLSRPVPFPTSDLADLVEVLRRARAVVAADTGPLHLAAAVGTPLVGLFGPKDPAIYGPHGARQGLPPGPLPVLVREEVACRPCRLRWCPDPVCMTSIEPEDVLRALRPHLPSERLVASTPTSPPR